MKRILITGINGFVGTNLTNNWAKYPVDTIVHLSSKAIDTKNQNQAQVNTFAFAYSPLKTFFQFCVSKRNKYFCL